MSDYPRQNGNGGPPPFPQSAHSRPESPRVVPNSDDYLLGSPQWQNAQAGRALTPLSTAPSSPILPAHQRPFYGGQSAAPSTEFLLPAPTSSRGSSRSEFQFNFNNNQNGNGNNYNNNYNNNNNDYNNYNNANHTPPFQGHSSHNSYSSYDNHGFLEGYGGVPRAPYESWSGRSTPSLMSRNNPFATPNDWDARSIADDRSANPSSENMNSLTEKFSIEPNTDLLIYPSELEADDAMHNPDEKDRRKRVDLNIWTKRGCVNLGALFIMVGGLLFLFIGYPVLTFVRDMLKETDAPSRAPLKCEGRECISGKSNPQLLQKVRRGLIDPDTPKAVYTKKSADDGATLKLAFSDEFNRPGRTFYPGDDPFWEAVDLWYVSTQDLEWYDPDAVSTGGGTLNIRFDKFKNNGLDYRSGMLQSWNKLCFKGGLIEMSISLPGDGETPGLWPGAWTLGNLARAGYQSTAEGLWPYSYHNECDIGITPNQSSSDGLSWLPGMKLPACTCEGEDHPSRGNSRGAPEIDIIEATVGPINDKGKVVGLASQSNQLAPFDIFYQPDYDFFEIYNRSISSINSYRGSNYQQSLSTLTTLNNDWYNGKAYQIYSFEYTPGDDGMVQWFVGEEPTWKMTADAVGPNGNAGRRTIAQEPMSIILNVGASQSFSPLDSATILKVLPATMRIDYVRIYQRDGQEVTCDPKGYPTTKYIEDHPKAYMNRELLTWDKTGYSWPKNSFMNNCK